MYFDVSTLKLFADDTNLYREIHDLDDCIVLQDDLNMFLEEIKKGGLEFFFENNQKQLKKGAKSCFRVKKGGGLCVR